MAQVSMNLEDHRRRRRPRRSRRSPPPPSALGVESRRGGARRLSAARGPARGRAPLRWASGGFRPGQILESGSPASAGAALQSRSGQAQAPQERRPAAGPQPQARGPRRPPRRGAGEGRAQAPPGRAGAALVQGRGAARRDRRGRLLPVPDLHRGRGPGAVAADHGPRLRADAAAGDAARPLALPPPDAQVGGAAGRPARRAGERGRGGARRRRGARATCCPGERPGAPAGDRRRPRRLRALRLRRDRDADLRGDRGLRARRRHQHRRGPQGDVHLRGPRRALPDACAPRAPRRWCAPSCSTACTSCRCR